MALDYTGWLVDTIYVQEQTGVDNYGDPSWGTKASRLARVETKQQMVLGNDGNERLSRHRVATATAIGLNARVWLPDDDDTDTTEARRPLAVESAATKDGSVLLYMTMF
jgi:hypothetical protein